MNEHDDFTYVPESVWRKELYPDATPATPTFLGVPVPEKAGGLWFAGVIERGHPMVEWLKCIEAIPLEHQERAKEYLRDRWRIRKERERRATGGKSSAAGDAAIAELSRRYGHGK